MSTGTERGGREALRDRLVAKDQVPLEGVSTTTLLPAEQVSSRLLVVLPHIGELSNF